MRVLFLASSWPSAGHTARAANLVLAHLLRATRALGHHPGLAFCAQAPDAPAEADPAARQAILDDLGVESVGDFSSALRGPVRGGPAARKWKAIASAFFPRPEDDPCFRKPRDVVRSLAAFAPDLCVLFWDTSFEYLLPWLDVAPCLGYLAKDRTAANRARLNARQPSGPRERLNAFLEGRELNHAFDRHLARLRGAAGLANICAVDAAAYTASGLPCAYVPNTFPDLFPGPRDAAPDGGAVEILGNIGRMDATGSSQGIGFLAERLLAPLEQAMAGREWRVTLCGGGRLPPGAARLANHPAVRLAGYVDDLEAQMAASHLFLMCNNVGPHTGGYTRVIYACSAGACLVAHRRLADSMPEIVHGHNALLGETAEELAGLIAQAAGDPALRRRLGVAARQTYEQAYAPEAVAARLLALGTPR